VPIERPHHADARHHGGSILLGDQDQAFTSLDKAYAERCEYLVYLPTEPMADPLRTDPRFPALLKRLGLKK